jgi:hypothetical protein
VGESSPADSGRAENLNRVPAESVCARSGARERAALHVVRPLGLGTKATRLDHRLLGAENPLVRFCQRNEYVAKLSTGPFADRRWSAACSVWVADRAVNAHADTGAGADRDGLHCQRAAADDELHG